MNNTNLRMERLVLNNYRCFTRLKIDFHPQMTVVVARNGCGKTAVLDAIAVALGPFIGAFDTGKGVHFSVADVRQSRGNHAPFAEMESQYPLTMEASGFVDGQMESWSRGLAGAKSHTTYGETRPLIKYGKALQNNIRENADGASAHLSILPLVSYYGTGRLWSEKRLTQGKKGSTSTSRSAGYVDCLDSSSRYKIFADWFDRLCRAEYEERNNPAKQEPIRKHLSAIRQAVDIVLRPCGWHSIAFRTTEVGIVVEHEEHGILPVAFLSDGIRNLIGLAADIAHRAVRLNAHLGRDAVRLTPGVVLIDEVDMHLHPEWQQVVLASLMEAFPSIQFIVTTHSPQVLTTAYRESVRVLKTDEDGYFFAVPDFQTRGVESADVLARIMGVNPVPPLQEAGWLNDYRAMIESGQAETQVALAMRSKLIAHFGQQHPLILDCDRLIRFQAFKANRPDAGKE